MGLGSEAMWAEQLGDGSEQDIEGRYWYICNVLGLTNFTWQDLSLETVMYADETDPGHANADTFDLSPFYENGGKMLHWHGMSDATVSLGASVYLHDHTQEVLFERGIEIDRIYQLYLIAGLEYVTCPRLPFIPANSKNSPDTAAEHPLTWTPRTTSRVPTAQVATTSSPTTPSTTTCTIRSCP
jgi:hypothetical protein